MRDNWEEKMISEFADVVSGGTPSTQIEFFWNGDINWITPTDLSKLNYPKIENSIKKITKLGLKNSSANLIPAESIVMSSRAPIGYFAIPTVEYCTNQGCKSIILNCDEDVNFHYYNFLFNVLTFKNKGEGTTFAEISKKTIEILKFKVPPFKQQQKIAQILRTCDTVLEKTEAAIAKYQALKQGLMHDLFTRGIDTDTGQLRPSYKDAPELYKETELGFVPNDWEVEALSELGEFKNGINKDKNSFGSGSPFVNISDAYSEQLELDKLGRVQVSEVEKANYKLEIDDIIFTRSSVKPSGVGYTTIFKGSIDTIVYSGFMIRYRIYDKQNFNGEYFNNYFRWSEFRRRLLCISTVSANTNVNQENLNRLLSIVPSIDEQILITKRLRNTDKKIQIEQQTLEKYKKLKAGLMQDLLSGKVGVEGLVNNTQNI